MITNKNTQPAQTEKIKITRDSGANVSLLKRLEKEGYVQIFDVMLENGREDKKVKNKIKPVGVWNHARWGECVWGGDGNEYENILQVVGKENIEDAMYLEAHLRSGNDYFVTEDKDDILSKKDKLLKQFGIKVVSPEELKKIVEKLFDKTQKTGIPAEWREVKLGEVLEKIIDNRGKTPATTDFGYELLEVNAVTDISKHPDYSKIRKFVSEDTYKTWFRAGHPQRGDILVPTVGTIGNVAILKESRGVIAQNIIALRINEENSNDYIYYFLKSPLGKNSVLSLDIGGVQPSVKVPHLLNLEFLLPPLPEQKAIAEVLSSLDDKIDLLHRQNKTLEDMAQALFRKWFVDEVDKRWKEVRLGDFFPVITGKKDANYSTDDGEYPFFTCAQNISYAPDYSFDGKAILLAGNGDFNVKRYEGKFEAYQRTYVLIPYEEKYFGFLYTLIKFYLDEITGGAQGSVIRFITKGMITNFIFLLPKMNFDDKLEQLNEIYSKVDFNQSQIRTLENLRDTLLPKLMSGEVRVVRVKF